MNGYNIEGNINNTLGKLDDTLNNMKGQAGNAFGLGKQIEQRPWLMIGAALVAGYVLGGTGGKSKSNDSQWRASDYASRYDDLDSRKSNYTSNQAQNQSHFKANTSAYSSQYGAEGNYGQSNFNSTNTSTHSPQHGVEGNYGQSNFNTTTPPQYGVEGSAWKPDATKSATFSPAATPQQPTKPKQNLIPESMNKHIDSAISAAGTTVRGMLRDAIRDNVPSMRDQVDALDRRDGRIPA